MLGRLPAAKTDPILSLAADFAADPRSHKMDLGIGVYRNEQGITPVMQAVKLAEQRLFELQHTKSYVGLAGDETFNQQLLKLVLTANTERAVAVQTPGASGALRMLAELIYHANPDATVWLSDPSYINHQPVMHAAGLQTAFYPYFDPLTKQVKVQALLDTLARVPAGDIVLLHGACHNPTGADLDAKVWQKIAELAAKQGFIPFVDLAYQGFGDGLTQDAHGINVLCDQLDEVLIATSCSKNFGLYRERTGAAIIVGKNAGFAAKGRATLLQLSRASYTMPPAHGASLVSMILQDPALTAKWQQELEQMRMRIKSLRATLTHTLNSKFGDDRFEVINSHKGMFSMLGLTPLQVARLRDEFGVYLVGDSRMNVAGINVDQIDDFSHALWSVLTRK